MLWFCSELESITKVEQTMKQIIWLVYRTMHLWREELQKSVSRYIWVCSMKYVTVFYFGARWDLQERHVIKTDGEFKLG